MVNIGRNSVVIGHQNLFKMFQLMMVAPFAFAGII